MWGSEKEEKPGKFPAADPDVLVKKWLDLDVDIDEWTRRVVRPIFDADHGSPYWLSRRERHAGFPAGAASTTSTPRPRSSRRCADARPSASRPSAASVTATPVEPGANGQVRPTVLHDDLSLPNILERDQAARRIDDGLY